MLTALKYYKTWSDPRLIVLVLNNEDLNQVTWEQRAMEGDPRFEGSQGIPYMPFADVRQPHRIEGHQGHHRRRDRGRVGAKPSPPTAR